MPRRARRPVTLVLALAGVVLGVVLAACQDYNFSPVRYCLIQPGTERVTLSDISTADLLFVVDDSGSMGGEQQKLQESFGAFVQNLRTTNDARVAVKLEPIDFHIAITTTSVFLNAQTSATCASTCEGVTQQVCCDTVTKKPLQTARTCATTADCKTVGNQCLDTCAQHGGEKTCCAGANQQAELVPVACATVGADCGRLLTRYTVTQAARLCTGATSCTVGPPGSTANPPAGYSCKTTCNGYGGTSACCDANNNVWSDPTCDIGVGTAGGLYPRGDFVRKGSNPRVLHFDKSLFCDRATDPATGKEVCACTLSTDPLACNAPGGNAAAIPALVAQFQANIAVGTCGSGQEQGLEAAKRAIEKALAGTQPAEASGEQPDWPHPRSVVAPGQKAPSKLVVVFVGDEDDCSTAEDVTGGVIFANSGNDACEADGREPPEQQKRTKLSVYAEYLASLGRPVAGAFIVSAIASDPPCATTAECQALCGATTCPANCVDAGCGAGPCCDAQCTGSTSVCSLAGKCGGQGAGYRFIDFSKILVGQSADTVVGSVCNPGEGFIGTPPAPPTPPPAASFQKKGFSSILDRVAEVVKQPAGLELPTQPASAQLTLLRIAAPDGKTRKTCAGPAPAGTAGSDLDPYDWWFTGGDDTDRTPTGPSKFIFLNLSTRACEANPGETYSADYLGLVPAGGCLTGADCQAALGGTLADWTCDLTQGGARGSCLCGSF